MTPLSQCRAWVPGHTGLLGSAVCRVLRERGAGEILARTHAELDLTEPGPVHDFLAETRPQVVFLCAARVGGIVANRDRPAEFLHDNLAIQSNVLHGAWRHGVERLVFMASSCIYPRECPQPMAEESLLGGPLEPTNQAYALAKIAGIEACRAYNHQYGTRFVALLPSNLYGPGDSYDLESSHVLPALIRKCHEAKKAGAERVVLWGSGRPLREFTYSDDAARAGVLLAELGGPGLERATAGLRWPMLNAGSGEEVDIAGLARRVAAAVGYGGGFELDPSRPDGVPRKLLDSRRIRALGWRPEIGLDEGLPRACRDFAAGHGACRPAVDA